MRPVITAAAVIIIAVCVNTQTQTWCRDEGGKCVAVAGRSCRMLQHNTCPDGAVCCARRSRKTKKNSGRRCKTSGKCRRKLGTCVSRHAGVCDSKTKDRWCKGRSCTCCLPTYLNMQVFLFGFLHSSNYTSAQALAFALGSQQISRW
nr:uncharacterized protein LOC128693892 [Cherax quadricarinatus]